MKNFFRILVFTAIMGIILVLSGCEGLGFGDDNFIAWTHVIAAENYTAMDGYAVYRITDVRFNTRDWFDVWGDDSFWNPEYGWSSFEGTYDSEAGRFYWEPTYYDGYMEWNTFSDTDIIGYTLRFYRRTHP